MFTYGTLLSLKLIRTNNHSPAFTTRKNYFKRSATPNSDHMSPYHI